MQYWAPTRPICSVRGLNATQNCPKLLKIAQNWLFGGHFAIFATVGTLFLHTATCSYLADALYCLFCYFFATFCYLLLLFATFCYFLLLFATFATFYYFLVTPLYLRLYAATLRLLCVACFATLCYFLLLFATFCYFCYFLLLFATFATFCYFCYFSLLLATFPYCYLRGGAKSCIFLTPE